MEQVKFADVWATLSRIDCSGHAETKRTGRDTELTYLSWAWAWTELMKHYPEATYAVREWDGRPWLDDPVAGVLVMTTVNIGGNERTMWLAAMDGANNALKREGYSYFVRGYNGQPVEKKVAAVDMCAINKAIMRCLVKNLAMFGLGLNIYAGEDLPVGAEAAGVAQDAPKQPSTASAPKRRPAPSAKAKEAWTAYKALPKVAALSEGDRNRDWAQLLRDECGKADSSSLSDADWDKVLNRISVEACM